MLGHVSIMWFSAVGKGVGGGVGYFFGACGGFGGLALDYFVILGV